MATTYYPASVAVMNFPSETINPNKVLLSEVALVIVYNHNGKATYMNLWWSHLKIFNLIVSTKALSNKAMPLGSEHWSDTLQPIIEIQGSWSEPKRNLTQKASHNDLWIMLLHNLPSCFQHSTKAWPLNAMPWNPSIAVALSSNHIPGFSGEA